MLCLMGLDPLKLYILFGSLNNLNFYISEKLALLEQEKFYANEFRSKWKDHKSLDARFEQMKNNLST